MTTLRGVLAVALLTSLGACAPAVDREAEREALRATDEAWAATASEGTDVEAIAAYWTDDATVYPPDAAPVRGKQAILEFVESSLSMPGFHVTWQPVDVAVAASGNMGYVTGTNEFTTADAEGELTTVRGHYVSVWRKDLDGNWKCVIDIFNYGAPTEATGEAD